MNPPEFDRLKQTLALQVRSGRIHKGLTQEDLADLAEIDRTYVSQLERAINNPSLLVVVKVANALGVTPLSLLTE